jgi:hypothetical protein
MQGNADVDVGFQLTPDAFTFAVDVRLRSFGDRWIAVAQIGPERQIGLGRNARQALAGALVSLGERVAGAFLADPSLLEASAEIARLERAPSA